ncbi:AI-2E family transporter [Nocardioides mesophilus]|uniref:AI-2E family transporter n=1 Tax=Nocardioides mesophilus TaxID=433659 RepID=A0A7G9R8R2_9ACTN|nr:AI-2E family transporter [Nocardioides mesophilus]QNN51987.1 AI-2E family transporter [Nocardioides mesophilus]
MSGSVQTPGRVTREASVSEKARAAEPVRALLVHPFRVGFFAAAGVLVAYWLGTLILAVSSIIILIVVAAFLAAGLNPLVVWLGRRGMRRPYAVLTVTLMVLAAIALFLVALVPVIVDQVSTMIDNAPGWIESLRHNHLFRQLDTRYDVLQRAQDYVTQGDFGSKVFGGVIGFGMAVLSRLANSFVVIVLTLYFLASLPKITRAAYGLAPASRRERVTELGDRIVANVGSYVSGAFLVAMCAGISSLIFLFAAGLSEYAVALAAVVTILDVIPMIGATLGAVLVTAIGFATDPTTGIACLIFYVVYQQIENYVIYPRVMSRSVDIPGSVIVIAALLGAGLLGVIGALLAIPTAAAILLIVREVVAPKMNRR